MPKRTARGSTGRPRWPQSSRTLHALGIAVWLLVASGVLVAPATAQEPPPEEEPAIGVDADGGYFIDEIVVTARKTEESLQETPISVTAFSTEELVDRSMLDVSEVALFTPNVEFDTTAPISGSSNAASIFIRGIGQTDFTPSIDPGVGVYLDGIYLARSIGSVLNLLDVERVEVLRGPQGTLFGKNTTGGAINILTTKPHAGLESDVEVTIGQRNRLDLRSYLNFPLGERLFGRFSVGSFNRDGYMSRVLVGDKMGNDSEWVSRLAFRWFPSDRLSGYLSFEYGEADEESAPSKLFSTDTRTPTSPFSIGDPGTIFAGQLYNVLIGAPGPGASVQFPFLPPLPPGTPAYDRRWLTDDLFTTNSTGPNGSSYSTYGVNLTLDWEIGDGLTAKSITGFRYLDTDFGRDPDGSPLTLIHTISAIDHEQLTQEFQLTGRSLEDEFRWIGGLFFLTEQGNHSDIVTFADETFQIYAALGIPIPNFFFIDGPKSENDIESIALFFEGTYDLTPALALSAGVRWTTERRKTVANYRQGGIQSVIDNRASATFEKLTPRVSLSYAVSDAVQTYLTYSEGFKSGGFNHRFAIPPPPFAQLARPTGFGPEEVDLVELGLKTELPGKRVRLNTSLFRSDYTDIQVLVFDLGVPRNINAAEARIDGLELEITAVPDPDWLVQLGYGYLDARYTRLDEDIPGSFGNPISILPLTTESRFVNTPEHSLALGVEYTHRLGGAGALRLRADSSFRTEIANDAINTPEAIQDDLWLLRTRATFAPTGRPWEVSAFVLNLTDEEYITSGVADSPGFGIGEITPGRPREWGLTLTYRFRSTG